MRRKEVGEHKEKKEIFERNKGKHFRFASVQFT
jgi:hypothetical protein